MESKHWGEILTIKHDSNVDVSKIIRESMQPDCLDKYDEEITFKNKYIHIELGDRLLLHAINLHQYANLLDENNIEIVAKLPKLIDKKQNSNKLNYLSPLSTKLKENDEEIPELNDDVSKQILYKCIGIMLAHIGYEKTSHSILDILVDVLDEFLKTISRKIRKAKDEEKYNSSGFPNVMERVLIEIGMNGVMGLQDYYENRVVKYIDVLYQRCEKLKNNYDAAKEEQVIKKETKIKEEALEDVEFFTIIGDNLILQ